MNVMMSDILVSQPAFRTAGWPSVKGQVLALGLMVAAMLVAMPAAASPQGDAAHKASVGDGIAAAREGRFHDAISIWEPHAANGDPVAHYGLGLTYAEERGPGMPARPMLSHLHYQAAAATGHVSAIFEVAFQYERGIGTQVEMDKALAFYRIAAGKNHLNAQYNLAVLLSHGGKVAPNLHEAYFWITAAQHNASIRPKGELTFEKVSELARIIRAKVPHQIASKAGRAATNLTGQPI